MLVTSNGCYSLDSVTAPLPYPTNQCALHNYHQVIRYVTQVPTPTWISSWDSIDKEKFPFQLRLDLELDSKWQLIVNHLAHNHPRSLNGCTHPASRRRHPQTHHDEIKRFLSGGESSPTFLSALRAKGAKVLRNACNFGQKLRLETCRGRRQFNG